MSALHIANARRQCRGVVLVIALVLLTAISLMAASTMRNSISNEQVSGAVRTVETALQAAEIALRHCEGQALASITSAAPGSAASSRTTSATSLAMEPPLWQDLANWNGGTARQVIVPLALINTAGAQSTYRRSAECLAEPLAVAEDVDGIQTTTGVTATVFVITARGFGSDAPAQPAMGRSTGTEVWLQSQIELIHVPGAATQTLRSWRQLIMR